MYTIKKSLSSTVSNELDPSNLSRCENSLGFSCLCCAGKLSKSSWCTSVPDSQRDPWGAGKREQDIDQHQRFYPWMFSFWHWLTSKVKKIYPKLTVDPPKTFVCKVAMNNQRVCHFSCIGLEDSFKGQHTAAAVPSLSQACSPTCAIKSVGRCVWLAVVYGKRTRQLKHVSLEEECPQSFDPWEGMREKFPNDGDKISFPRCLHASPLFHIQQQGGNITGKSKK